MKRLSFALGFLLLNVISFANPAAETPNTAEYCMCELYVPNVFSPNNDGANDFFLPATNCILEDYTFSVYNRWGQLLFQTTNPSEGWDGRAKNEFAAHDTYIYSIEYRFAEFPDPLVEYGSVALIR
ncbi:MAG: gliding motility-associated C-terminal domain-containing protein [Bacteroidota bacterium]